MRYFDAQTRAKTYIQSAKIKTIEKTIHSGDYLKISVIDRMDYFTDWMEEVKDFSDCEVVKFIINVEDSEDFLNDEEVFGIMSNISTAYSRVFKKQTEKVLTPNRRILDSLPISPASIMSLTMLYIVDKPFQILINRSHRASDSFEQVELI